MNRMKANQERSRSGRRSGFTLIETAMASVIIGTGVLAIISAQEVLLKKNHWSSMTTTATLLGNEIRELTLNLPRHDPVTGTTFWGPESDEMTLQDFDDVDDFDGPGEGIVFSSALGNGPINAARAVITDMDGWEQIVRVMSVDPFDITTAMDDAETDMVRVEVLVRYRGPNDDQPMDMTTITWIAPN
ncbi:MAG TPA: hypothetical protein DCX60_10940 [Phycisphaerales bacterium]|nr:hypothetical protein [Phycisphaerales bacterium]